MSSTAQHVSSAKRDFDIELVANALSRCCLGGGGGHGDSAGDGSADVSVDDYLAAFHELCRFFKLVGPVFTFVAHDISHKIGILERLRHSSHGDHYATVCSMANHELDAGIVAAAAAEAPVAHASGRLPSTAAAATAAPGRTSGTRTLLRLHWALEFIIEFMERVRDAAPRDERTSRLAQDVYDRTLAHHHPWLTRQLASLAVRTLPNVRTLIEIMCRHDFEHVIGSLERAVTAGRLALAAVDNALRNRRLINIT